MRGLRLHDAISHKAFIYAQRGCLLTLPNQGEERDVMVHEYSEDWPLAAILLTTSSGRENYLEDYRIKHHPKVQKKYEAIEKALGELVEGQDAEAQEALFCKLDELECEGMPNPYVDPKCLFPMHMCHWMVGAHAVLAKLRYPNDKLEVLTNEWHSTVRRTTKKGAVSYIDYLVTEPQIKGFEKRGGGWDLKLDLADIAVEDVCVTTMEAVLETSVAFAA